MSDDATDRLEQLELRPRLERELADQLREIVAELEANGIPRERSAAQTACKRLLATARQLDSWAVQDAKRVGRLTRGLRGRSSASPAARAAIAALLGDRDRGRRS